MQTIKTISKKNKLVAVLAVAILLVLSLALSACSGGSSSSTEEDTDNESKIDSSISDKAESISKGEGLVINKSDLTDKAKFYTLKLDGQVMEVVAVRTADGVDRTAFNTCQVCNGSPLAYFEQEGDFLICQNCKNQFAMESVEVQAGGCNPLPIFSDEKESNDTEIIIPYDTLLKYKANFTTWKVGI